MTLRRGNGFTLIEVLVAMAIFGVLSMLAYSTLGQTLANSEMLTERIGRAANCTIPQQRLCASSSAPCAP
jgi:prepilin-type N-terminal cleavage/methylation domain-containing protein